MGARGTGKVEKKKGKEKKKHYSSVHSAQSLWTHLLLHLWAAADRMDMGEGVETKP